MGVARVGEHHRFRRCVFHLWAEAWLCGAQNEETQAKQLVLQWEKVKEEVKALEELEQEARKEVRCRELKPVQADAISMLQTGCCTPPDLEK